MLKLSGTKLHFSTAYHPQSDGQTEVRNRGLEQYLRAFVADRPAKWANFLPWAELALNCFHHDGLVMSPFQALYGREPPLLVASPPSASTPANVVRDIRQRGELLVTLRGNLERAQTLMRCEANRHWRHVEFKVGDRVLLKLQQYRQHSVARPVSAKLARRYYGPFVVLERIGQVAYRLKLLEGSRIHDVFHVGLLRPFVEGMSREPSAFPVLFARGQPIARPTRLLERRSVWCDGSATEEGRVQWSDDGGVSPTWEPMSVIEQHFPELLEDKETFNEGGVDTDTLAELKETEAQRNLEDQAAEFTTTTEVELAEIAATTRRERPRRQPKPVVRYGDFVTK